MSTRNRFNPHNSPVRVASRDDYLQSRVLSAMICEAVALAEHVGERATLSFIAKFCDKSPSSYLRRRIRTLCNYYILSESEFRHWNGTIAYQYTLHMDMLRIHAPEVADVIDNEYVLRRQQLPLFADV